VVYISYPCTKLPSKEGIPGRLNVSLLNELNFAAFLGFPKPTLRHCVDALGMHSGQLPDSAITASSSFHPTNFAPKIGRLHYLSSGSGTGGSWAAGGNNPYQWLQVDLGNWTRVTGVATQGRQDSSQWVKSYSLSTNDGQFFEFLKTESGVKKVHFMNSGNLKGF